MMHPGTPRSLLLGEPKFSEGDNPTSPFHHSLHHLYPTIEQIFSPLLQIASVFFGHFFILIPAEIFALYLYKLYKDILK